MTAFRQDVLCALRLLRRERGLAAVVLLTLGLAIGANTLVFSLVDAALIRPLPYRDSDRLVSVRSRSAKPFYVRGQESGESLPRVLDWQNQSGAFEALAAYAGGQYVLGRGIDAERVRGSRATAGFWRVCGVAPFLGRPFDAGEYRNGGNKVAAISYALWQRRFASDPRAIGRTLAIDNESFTIVAVMPADFRFVEDLRASFTAAGSRIDLLLPAVDEPWVMNRMVAIWEVAGRLKPGVSLAQARARMDTISRRLARQHPETDSDAIVVDPLRRYLRGDTEPVLRLLWCAVTLVLAIACFNVCSLLLARGESHMREAAIRAALGAGRARLVRHALTETTCLALGGGLLGVLLGVCAVPWLNSYRLAARIGIPELHADVRVVCFGIGAALLVGLLTGLPVAWRVRDASVVTQIKDMSLAGARGLSVQSGFVVAQIALSVALLTGASLLLRSFLNLWGVNPGFDSERVLTMALNLDSVRYQGEAQRVRFLNELEDRIRVLPGVEAAGVVSGIPMSGAFRHGNARVVIEGQPGREVIQLPRAQFRVASSEFFRAMGIPVHAGAPFPETAEPASERLCLLNRTMARRYFGGVDPTGTNLQVDGIRYRVSGVVGDARFFGLQEEPRAEVFLASRQSAPANMFVVVRSRGVPSALGGALRRTAAVLDPELATYEIQTMERILSNAVASRRLILWLTGGFAGLALLLTAVGVHGLLSYFVSQRRREIGIRLAIGARGIDVLYWVFARGMRLVVPGLLMGAAMAWMCRGLLASQLVGVSTADPLAFMAAPSVVLSAAIAACLLPASQATRLDLLTILRGD